jgi:alkanesulfonate monooxygenase SsuD/methylene tetrahydromethanopterin reductase-like flavin-dependent oxidoreductase (luciferase family)
VSGWFKGEFTGYGEPWLDHTERYRRSEEFIRIMKGMWNSDVFTFYGDFYTIDNAPCYQSRFTRFRFSRAAIRWMPEGWPAE